MKRNATFTGETMYGDASPMILSETGYGVPLYPAVAGAPAVPAAAAPGVAGANGFAIRSDFWSSPAFGMILLFAGTAYFVARRDRWG